MSNDFWPKNDAKTLYLAGGCSLEELLEATQAKWPGVDPARIEIEPEYIHTHCLGYDLYDSGDYTNFIVARLRDE